jgi:hypothetical protein
MLAKKPSMTGFWASCAVVRAGLVPSSESDMQSRRNAFAEKLFMDDGDAFHPIAAGP